VYVSTNVQYGRPLQLIIEHAHDAALPIFVERCGRFVEIDPSRFVQQNDEIRRPELFSGLQIIATTVPD